MKSKHFLLLGCLLICLHSVYAQVPTRAQADSTVQAQFPSFLKNAGQWDPLIKYEGLGSHGSVSFLDNGISFCATRSIEPAGTDTTVGPPKPIDHEMRVWNLVFKDAGAGTILKGSAETPSVVNYIRSASDSENFIHVPEVQKLTYYNVFKQTDVEYLMTDSGMKYNVILHPGAVMQSLAFTYKGIRRLGINANRELEVDNGWDVYRESIPYSYQLINGVEKQVRVGYTLQDDSTYGFRIESEYDPAYDLVIDPFYWGWSSYLRFNGSGAYCYDVAMDVPGNVYLTGYSWATHPVTPGVFQPANAGYEDAYVAKLSPNLGSLVYFTFLGGSGTDIGNGIDVDVYSNVYITGYTKSVNFPHNVGGVFGTSYRGNEDGFITKLLGSGAGLWYSKFIGGSQADRGHKVWVNRNTSEAYVTGETRSSNMQVSINKTTPYVTYAAFQSQYQGNSDAFVVKMQVSGNDAVYSSYFGGSLEDRAFDIAVDSLGFFYIGGYTTSPNFPSTMNTYMGNSDGFVVKFKPNGQRLYSRFYGGSSGDAVYGLDASNSAGEVFLTGATASSNNISTIAGNIYSGSVDAFVARLNAGGNISIYSRYLGGTAIDRGLSIVTTPAREAIVSGFTTSTNFPTYYAFAQIQPTNHGLTDMFVSHFTANGTGFGCGGSTYFGGSNHESYVTSYQSPRLAFRSDPVAGNYIALAGTTYSTDFPNRPAGGGYQPTKPAGPIAQPVVLKLNISCYLPFSKSETADALKADPVENNMITAAPNPFNNNSIVQIKLIADSRTTVQVFSSNGDPLVMLYDGYSETEKQITATLNGFRLLPGIYTVRMTNNKGTSNYRLVKLH